ncbi:MAG: hypothetical protein FWG64_13660 [Firmicutes bacterium]|nr:hypothetical protein [Bacillota bacterium]
MTKIISISHIDINNQAEVQLQLENFAQKYANATIEYSCEICTDGTVYTLRGNETSVDPTIIGITKLVGAIGIHNHPPNPNGTAYDSFSKSDLLFCCKYKQGKQYVVSLDRRNAFEFTKFYTEDEIYFAYRNALKTLRNLHFRATTEISNEQEEILKILNNELKGFEFYENF